jgi:hypothetical protein
MRVVRLLVAAASLLLAGGCACLHSLLADPEPEPDPALVRAQQARVTSASGLPACDTTQHQLGGVLGRVVDQSTGEPMFLVTVVATSPSLSGAVSELTDERGSYAVCGLPPGTYTMQFYFGEARTRRENGKDFGGDPVSVDATMKAGW